jgi:hypothetical protein
MVKAANDGELMPLEFMLRTLRDEERDFADRYKAAVDAAPYLHPRLSATRVAGEIPHAIAQLLKTIDGKTRGIPSRSGD